MLIVMVFINKNGEIYFFRNQIYLDAIKSITQNKEFRLESTNDINKMAMNDCHLNWLLNLVAFRNEDNHTQERTLKNLLLCTDIEVEMFVSIQSNNLELIEYIVKNYPNNVSSIFRLSELIKEQDPVRSVKLLRVVTKLNPHHELAWCRLGYYYEIKRGFPSSN